eukprot:scaffold5708_cov107-Isochrysis_galbana.AAC.2
MPREGVMPACRVQPKSAPGIAADQPSGRNSMSKAANGGGDGGGFGGCGGEGGAGGGGGGGGGGVRSFRR